MTHRSFLARVRHILPELHPAERRLGELVRNFPGELASYSASELAALAGVSNATVSRFVKRLGYQSYEDARRDAREESSSGSRLYLQHAGDEKSTGQSAFLETDIRNIRETIDDIGTEEIEGLAHAILAARRVWCIGFRASGGLANYLHWQLLQAVDDAVCVPGGGQTMGEHVARMKPEDVIILFGLRRRVATLQDLMRAIQGTGANIAYVTDEGVPRNKEVGWHFRCATRSSGPLFSHVGVMALLNIIANRTIEFAAESGGQRLKEIETYNDLLREL
ncbi:MurR/RpiR family transcriptional regulator [Sinirhodobacter huangdaonensis]|uniref:MurR/RpiR family transcriptional regulator n=1 Tax=Paenirhodobacter huangdaonensis TaxID=2501515 RepID=A0A3S3LIE1_9RHOB|nr:MurR/RpiR family transcriptional regulator [Sinirhodobacter huangdaonensis]RWR47558.1 MurR/RpiR family transcriptional regulator [Sinirhodobacter huangdaonensis]